MSLELEEEWAKQKAAKQEAGRKPPPKSRKGLIVALVGILVTAAMVTVVILAGSKDESAPLPPDETVKIEMRAMPTAEIRVDGKKVGTTPMSLQYTRSTREIVVEATMYRHLVKRGASKDEKYVEVRKVTLDQNRLLDFKISTATLVEKQESD